MARTHVRPQPRVLAQRCLQHGLGWLKSLCQELWVELQRLWVQQATTCPQLSEIVQLTQHMAVQALWNQLWGLLLYQSKGSRVSE